jgi:hypothetical protein
MEAPTTLHYLAIGRHGPGTREERDRLLAEAEVIPGGWPFPLDLQQWSGIARADPNLRRRDPGRETLCFDAMLRAANRPSQHRNQQERRTTLCGKALRGVPLLLCNRYFK